jgi:hypothetical protein
MYYNTNLFHNVIDVVSKRKAPSSITRSYPEDTLRDDVLKLLPSMIKRQKVNDFSGVLKLAEEALNEFDRGYEIAQSDHGLLNEDDDFYADLIDLVDL